MQGLPEKPHQHSTPRRAKDGTDGAPQSSASLVVFYTPAQVADALPRSSPSPRKPKEVLADWQASGLRLEIRAPLPATRDELVQVHAPDFVDGILAGRIRNGFGDTGRDVIDSLPYTVGAMRDAALHALQTRRNTAALVSGFHHAGYDRCGAFCTFNGLMVAACAARAAGARRVGILDLDYHYGDGTADIIMRLQPNWLIHYSAGEHWRRPEQAEAFLAALPGIVSSCITDCDVLICQAGADPLLGDPLGGFLTAAQLRERDRIVFQTANSRAVPVAWDLAGGYSRDSAQTISPVLGVHRNTAIESLAAACPDALSS